MHNRGAFARGLSKNGVYLQQAGLETPEHIGRCERHGGIIRRSFRRLIRDHHLTDKDGCKLAMAECVIAKNEFTRIGGFAPVQWVLGRMPQGIGHILDEEELGHLGVLSSMQDGATEFGRRAEFRHTARKAFVHEDYSRRMRSALLRKSGPLPGKYQAGDLVCYIG